VNVENTKTTTENISIGVSQLQIKQEAQLMLTTGSTPFLRYSSSKNFMTLKWGSKVTQGN